MAMNRIQFQPGLSLPAFLEQYGTEPQCEAALERARWPQGFRCPECGAAGHYRLQGGAHKTFQCKACRLQTALIAGTLFQSTHLALTRWFLAIYLISQAKIGLSALALKRQLGASEKILKRLGDDDYEKIYLYPNSHADYYPGAKPIAMKVLFRKSDGRLLGAQALGEDGVDKRISAFAALLQMGATIHDLEKAELCYAHSVAVRFQRQKHFGRYAVFCA